MIDEERFDCILFMNSDAFVCILNCKSGVFIVFYRLLSLPNWS